jgi:hypothetical protein
MNLKSTRQWTVLMTLAAVLLSGCNRHQSAPKASVAPLPQLPADKDASTQPNPGGDTPAADPAAAPAVVTAAVSGEYDVPETVNSAVSDFCDGEGRMPKNLEEVVAKKYLRAIPQLPEGMTYKMDAAKHRVLIVPSGK